MSTGQTKLAVTRELTNRLVDTVNSQQPTQAQLAELRQALQDAPHLVEVLGELTRLLRDRIIAAMATDQKGLHLAMGARADQLAKELGGGQCSPLEHLLIDQLVIAWLRWQSVEWTYQRAHEGSQTLTHSLYLEKRLTAAQGRYLRAAESLARVRGLLKRAPVQVNTAQQQVVQNGRA